MFLCPVCEHENDEDAAECALCGKQLLLEGLLEEDDAATLDGLEVTVVSVPEVAIERLEVEQTSLSDPRLRVAVEPLPVARAEVEVAVQPGYWQAGMSDLESGRESDGLPASPAPVAADQPAPCGWCGTVGSGVLCEACGRRRVRGLAAARVTVPGRPLTARQRTAAEEDTILCPSCLTRVRREGRCPECRSPLPLSDLY